MLHAAALSALAVAQPVLDLIAKHPGFLVAHRATRFDLAALPLALGGVLPLAAALAVGGAMRLLPRQAGRIAAGSAGGWLFVAALPAAKRLLDVPALGLVALCLLAAMLGAWAYLRWAPARSFCSWLALGLVVIPVVFFWQPTVRRLWRQEVQPEAYFGKVGATAPIVMVVFDAFPLASLLDRDHAIDAERFPHLAQLAGQATWFRNATAVHELTGFAVPAILTGNYPQRVRLPTLGDHPYNLFTWLGGEYRLNVFEDLTRLCPVDEAAQAAQASSRWSRLGRMLVDAGVVLGHVLLPAEWAARLPGVTATWNDFLGPSVEEFKQRAGVAHIGRLGRFQRFLESIDDDGRPALHFLHVLLPHDPFAHTPSGRLYVPPSYVHLAGFDEGTRLWSTHDWLVTQAHQRHLLQVKLVDELVGRLVARLKAQGLYDKSLVVITADHGESFWPAEARRDPARTAHPWDIMSVPLLVKAPGQLSGKVDDRNVETVDILPTMAAALGVSLPWPVEGRSALDVAAPPRAEKRIISGRWQERVVADESLVRFKSLTRQHDLFGTGAWSRVFEVGPHKSLVGQKVDSVARSSRRVGRAELQTSLLTWGEKYEGASVPALIVGYLSQVTANSGRIDLALAVDDRIVAVCPGLDQGDGTWGFSVLAPEEALPPGRHRLAMFQVTQIAAKPALSPLELVPNEVTVTAATVEGAGQE